MKKRPNKEELLAQFYKKESRAESVKRRLSGVGKRVPIVPVLVVVMLVLVVVLSGVLVSKSNLEFDFASYDEKLRSPAGWSDDQRLTDSSYDDVSPQIDVSGDKVHVVWEHRVAGIGTGHYDIYYKNSSDAGYSWSSSAILSKGTDGCYAKNPDIGVSDSDIHVVWNKVEIWYRNSTDGGVSWNDRRRLSEDDGNISNDPSISVVGNDLHVAWTDTRHSGTEVYYIRSLDGGVTWNDGQGGEYGRRLTNTAGDSTFSGIVKEGNTVHVLYTDHTDGDFDVYYTVSYDNGVTWESGVEIAGSPTDYGPAAIAVNGSMVHVAWVEYDGDYYIWYRNSTDNGDSWGSTQQLVGPSPSAWAPELACNESHVYMVWNDQRDDGTHSEVYIMNSTNMGGEWGAETRLTEVDNEHSGGPDICLSDGGKYVVWIDLRNGNDEIYFKRSPDFIMVPEFPSILLPITLTILTYAIVSKNNKRKWRKKHENK